MDHSKRRRKAIQKLDFDNCEVGPRKELTDRKQIGEYKNEIISSSQSQGSNKNSSQQGEVRNSPILFRKCSSQKRIHKTPSPILITKQKSVLRKRFKIHSEPRQSTSVFMENTTSPVFKLKSGLNKRKAHATEMDKPDKSKPSYDIVTDDDYSADEFVIEDFSQEPSKDSEECKISNFSSESRDFSQQNISEDRSMESELYVLQTPTKDEPGMETIQELELDSGKKRKRHKRGGLVEKLLNLRKMQASERRIRDHRRKIMKIEEIWKKNLHVVETWKDSTLLTLKCQQMNVSEGGSLTNSDPTDFLYVILNRNIGNCFNKIRRGTFLRVASPWQEMRLPVLSITVMLSVNFIEIVYSLPDIAIPKRVLRQGSVTKYKEDESLLFNTIFATEENLLFR